MFEDLNKKIAEIKNSSEYNSLLIKHCGPLEEQKLCNLWIKAYEIQKKNLIIKLTPYQTSYAVSVTLSKNSLKKSELTVKTMGGININSILKKPVPIKMPISYKSTKLDLAIQTPFAIVELIKEITEPKFSTLSHWGNLFTKNSKPLASTKSSSKTKSLVNMQLVEVDLEN